MKSQLLTWVMLFPILALAQDLVISHVRVSMGSVPLRIPRDCYGRARSWRPTRASSMAQAARCFPA